MANSWIVLYYEIKWDATSQSYKVGPSVGLPDIVSAKLTYRLGDTTTFKFSYANRNEYELKPLKFLIEVGYGTRQNYERKFFGTLVKKTKSFPDGITQYEAVGVLGSYKYLPNFNGYSNESLQSIIGIESNRFRGQYAQSSPYYTPSAWELLYSGNGDVPADFGTLSCGISASMSCNIESLQKNAKNAYEFLKSITRDGMYTIPSGGVKPTWIEGATTATFDKISGVNTQEAWPDDSLISITIDDNTYYTKVDVVNKNTKVSVAANEYPLPFNYARVNANDKADGRSYSTTELTNIANAELSDKQVVMDAVCYDKHLIDNTVPWFDMSKKVVVHYPTGSSGTFYYAEMQISEITYDLCDSSKDRVKLGKIQESLTDSLSGDVSSVQTSGGTMTGSLSFVENGQSATVDANKIELRDRIFGTCNLIDMASLEQGSIYVSTTGQDEASTTRLRSGYTSVKPSTTYTISQSSSTYVVAVCKYGSNKAYLGFISVSSQQTYTFTTDSSTYFIRVLIQYNPASTIQPSAVTNLMLEKGSSASSYVPYAMDNVELTKRVTWKYRGELVNTVSFDEDDVELMIVPKAYGYTMQRAVYFISDLNTAQSPSNIVSAFQTTTSYAWATFYRSGNSIILQDKQVGSSWSAGNVKFYVYTRK